MSSGFRKVIFLVVILGVVYLAFQYMIKPANKNLSEQKVRVQAKLDKLAQLQQTKDKVHDLGGQVDELQGALSFFESKLPPSSEIHKVLKQVTLIARQNGLVPKTIQTLAVKQNNGYIEQPLKMNLEGDFISYYVFLTELERMDRITRIRELELKKLDSKDGSMSATFVVSVFFQNAV